MLNTTMLLKSIMFVFCASIVSSEPSDCESHLNNGDCGLRPTLVYTYLSSLFLCHAVIWRGCPTTNKFDTLQQCSSACFMNTGGKKTANADKSPICDIPLNRNNCSHDVREVYTFDFAKRICVKASWHGCPTENMFKDLETCTETCYMISALQEVDTLNELIKQYDTSRAMKVAK